MRRVVSRRAHRRSLRCWARTVMSVPTAVSVDEVGDVHDARPELDVARCEAAAERDAVPERRRPGQRLEQRGQLRDREEGAREEKERNEPEAEYRRQPLVAVHARRHGGERGSRTRARRGAPQTAPAPQAGETNAPPIAAIAAKIVTAMITRMPHHVRIPATSSPNPHGRRDGRVVRAQPLEARADRKGRHARRGLHCGRREQCRGDELHVAETAEVRARVVDQAPEQHADRQRGRRSGSGTRP